MRQAIQKIEGLGVYLAPQPLITVLGVKYLHLRVEDGTDLYVTEYGLPFVKCLMPQNHWADDAWMKAHSVRLPGTSALHRVTTKTVDGKCKEIVLKWNRMGQDIPGETQARDAADAEFNSPFVEFSLVLELRNTRFESPGRLYTHKPLAIYVPRKYVQGEQLGRRRHRMEAILRSHDEIAIDWNRNYAVIYEWLKGIDAAEACRTNLLNGTRVDRLGPPGERGTGTQRVHGQRQQTAAHHRPSHARRAVWRRTRRASSCTGWWTSSCCGERRPGNNACGRGNVRTT